MNDRGFSFRLDRGPCRKPPPILPLYGEEFRTGRSPCTRS